MQYRKPKIEFVKLDDGMYEAQHTYLRYFDKYKKWLCLPKGFVSDGATLAFDIESDGWWWHDLVCRKPEWFDGSAVSDCQASDILSIVLKEEGRAVRHVTWRYATWVFRSIGHKLKAFSTRY